VPPSDAPGVHFKPIVVPNVTARSLTKVSGASGTVNIIAPVVVGSEVVDHP